MFLEINPGLAMSGYCQPGGRPQYAAKNIVEWRSTAQQFTDLIETIQFLGPLLQGVKDHSELAVVWFQC